MRINAAYVTMMMMMMMMMKTDRLNRPYDSPYAHLRLGGRLFQTMDGDSGGVGTKLTLAYSWPLL